MSNDMVEAEALADFPGAPFSEGETDAAVETLRGSLFWHVAPVRENVTITLDTTYMQRRLFLPTRKLVEVSEIRAKGEEVDPELYSVSINFGRVLRKSGYWPSGDGSIEVDMTHGYESVPLELLSVIAAIASTTRRDQTVRQTVAGPYTLSLAGMDRIIDRYGLWRMQPGWA